MKKEVKEKVREALREGISPFYTNRGFVPLKNKLLFTKDVFEVLFSQMRDDGDNISFTPQLRVANDSIGNILTEVLPKNFIKHASAKNVGATLAKMLDCQDFNSRQFNHFGKLNFYTYQISSLRDVDPVVVDHKEFMEKVGFPFFDRLSSIDSIDKFLAPFILEGSKSYFLSEERQSKLLGHVDVREAYSCLIASFLSKNERYLDILDRLTQRYEDTLIHKNMLLLHAYLEKHYS